jgi:thiamine-phosphate pyrophosphorylase
MKAGLRFPAGLYGVTPEWDDTNQLIQAIEAAAAGGMAALQWRRKTIAAAERLPQAAAIAACCKRLGVVFIVNDDWQLAAAVNADGVHLGRDDGSLAEARLALGTGKIIGCSCYNEPGLAQQAVQGGADYIAFGAMYPSMVKPGAVRAGLGDIRQGRLLAAQTGTAPRVAVVAIGGITADNAAPVIQAGADSIAVISGLFAAGDIRATALRCSQLFPSNARPCS